MSQGQVLSEGEAKKILTNPDLVEQSSLVMPEITQIFWRLSNLGFPKDVIDLYEAKKILLDRIGELK